MRYESFAEKEYYHVFARGVNKEKIFIDDRDKARFIFLITHLQSPTRLNNVTWYTENFIKKGIFNLKEEKIKEILKHKSVELTSFALMPNHFHLLIRNMQDGILSVYMHRILTAYSKYFNKKYARKGHVFEGPFGAVRIKNNEQLLYISSYIHKNPKEIKDFENSYDRYPHSSYQDFLGQNRWGDLLSTEIILKQFKDKTKYSDFVSSSIAKEKL